MRKSDTWFLDTSFHGGEESVREVIKSCKVTVDDYYKNPSDYED